MCTGISRAYVLKLGLGPNCHRFESPSKKRIDVTNMWIIIEKRVSKSDYGVATISRLHKIIGLFCKRAL